MLQAKMVWQKRASNIPTLVAQLPRLRMRTGELWAKDAANLGAQLTPVLTGRLQRSNRAEERDGRWWYIVGGIVVDGKMVDYAVFVEYGTDSQDAQPFFRPACQEISNNIFLYAGKAIQEWKAGAK